jgi:hypothetical protein
MKRIKPGGRIRINKRTRATGVTPGKAYWVYDVTPVEDLDIQCIWVAGDDGYLVMLFDHEVHSVKAAHMCELCVYFDVCDVCEHCYGFSEFVEIE